MEIAEIARISLRRCDPVAFLPRAFNGKYFDNLSPYYRSTWPPTLRIYSAEMIYFVPSSSYPPLNSTNNRTKLNQTRTWCNYGVFIPYYTCVYIYI